MNERKLKQLNILVIAVILISIASAVLFSTKFSPMNENKITGVEIKDLSKNIRASKGALKI